MKGVWGKLFSKSFPHKKIPYPLPSKLAKVAFGAVGIDCVVGSDLADGNEISNVAVAEHARRKMRDEVIGIPNDEKLLPSLCDGERYTAVEHARTPKSKAEE